MCVIQLLFQFFAVALQISLTHSIKIVVNQALARGKAITRVICDNSGENSSEELIRFYEEKGIAVRFANPYTSNQNAVAERRIRTLMDKNSWAIDMKVQSRFWSQAAITAAFLINVMMKRNEACPYEKWEGIMPDYGKLTIFGCKAAVRVPRKLRSKLGVRATIGMMAGYTDNGYFIVIPGDKYVYSRDVVFDELSRGQEVLDQQEQDEELRFQYSQIDKSQLDEWGRFNDEITRRMLVPEENETHVDQHYEWASPEDEQRMDSMVERVNNEARGNGLAVENILPDGTSRRRPQTQMSKKIRQSDVVIPESYRQMMLNDYVEQWRDGLNAELAAMEDLGVFDISDKPEGRKLMSTRYVFALKESADGFVERFKVRRVARGFSQIEGIDYYDTYSSVVSATAIRFICSIIAENQLVTRQIDISTAYLNSPLKEELFMEIPQGYEEYVKRNLTGKYLKLKKALPGTKQGAVAWYDTCSDLIKGHGFKNLLFEESLFVKGKNIIMLYVDDMVLVAETEKELDKMELMFRNKFKLTVHGELNSFLKMEFRLKKGLVSIGQSKYIEGKIRSFGLDTRKVYKVPMNVNIELGNPDDYRGTHKDYSRLIGSLLYAQQRTRPDFSFPVHKLAGFSQGNDKIHYDAGLKILSYLGSSKEKKLIFRKCGRWKMEIYVDASFGVEERRKSVGGYIILINGTSVAWRCYKQKYITESTAESEFVALNDAVRAALWIGNILKQLGYAIDTPSFSG